MLAGLHLTRQEFHSEFVSNQVLNSSLQRPCAERWIIAFLNQRIASRSGKIESDLPIFEVPPQNLQLNIDNLCDFILSETPENDDVVDAVEKFRFEVRTEHLSNVIASRAPCNIR